MSRTSTRASRPLIAALGLIIVLGLFFTVHKLKTAKAEAARKADLARAEEAQREARLAPPKVEHVAAATQPLAAAAPKTTSATPTTASTTTPEPGNALVLPADSSALVTQTPTAPPASSTSDQVVMKVANPESPPTEIAHTEASPALAAPSSGQTSARVSSSATSSQPLSDAKTQQEAGHLLEARDMLNESLRSGQLTGSDADQAKQQLQEINQTVVFSPRKFPEDKWGGVYEVASGERLATIANKNGVTWELLSRVNKISPSKMRANSKIKILKGPFHAVVYKSRFTMEIYLGSPSGPESLYITSFPVGLGKDNSTPTGLWQCKAGDKIRHPKYYSPRGEGIIDANDPKNPLGGYWIAIEGLEGQAVGKESYGIHGTIDPTSIGKMESMGCIRLKSEDISWVFDLLVDGKSKVLIKD